MADCYNNSSLQVVNNSGNTILYNLSGFLTNRYWEGYSNWRCSHVGTIESPI